MGSSYSELRFFRGHDQTITTLHPERARHTCERLALQTPDNASDLKLFRLCEADDTGAFLCLRCRVSDALLSKVKEMADKFRSSGVQLHDIAGFALLDDGDRQQRQPLSYVTLRQQPDELILPFTALVICRYDPERGAGLPHWARQRFNGYTPLKKYLLDVFGITLISNWTLLAESSPTRLQAAWPLAATTNVTLEQALALHEGYCRLYSSDRGAYRLRRGRRGDYEPSDDLLRTIQPEMPVKTTLRTLEAMATAIRRYKSPGWYRQINRGNTPDADGPILDPIDALPDPRSLDEDDGVAATAVPLIRAALDRALASHMPAVLAAAADAQIRCLWLGFAEGLRSRAIAERCGCSQSFVSRQLRSEQHAGAIAQKAVLELTRHSTFEAVAASPEGAVRMVDALKQQLLATQPAPSEQEEGSPLPTLQQWVHRHLPAS